MVVYKDLYGETDIWVRPLTMFLDQKEVDGKMKNRFIESYNKKHSFLAEEINELELSEELILLSHGRSQTLGPVEKNGVKI